MKHHSKTHRILPIRFAQSFLGRRLVPYQIAMVLCLCLLLTLALPLIPDTSIGRVLFIVFGTVLIVFTASRPIRGRAFRTTRSFIARVKRSSTSAITSPRSSDRDRRPTALEAWDQLATYIGPFLRDDDDLRTRLAFARRRLVSHASKTDGPAFLEILQHFQSLPNKKQAKALTEWVRATLPPTNAKWSFEDPAPLLFRQDDRIYWKGVNMAKELTDVFWWQPFDRTTKARRALWDAAIALHQIDAQLMKRKSSTSAVTFGEWIMDDERYVTSITNKITSEKLNHE